LEDEPKEEARLEFATLASRPTRLPNWQERGDIKDIPLRHFGSQSREDFAVIAREVIHTCSNASVAQAALASIGGDFMNRFAAEARRRDLPSGSYAARLVSNFGKTADAADWRRANEATRGVDQPVLSCLRFILDQGLQKTTASAS
jgi:hypothetical protein